MSKKSIIFRDKNKINLEKKYRLIRQNLKKKIKKSYLLKSKMKINKVVHNLPRNSILIRIRKRCSIKGRPRGYYRYFGQSRNLIYEQFNSCKLPGSTISSW
uniref:ribosomal protein S14 n=1 Tax=Prosopanche panguanensis TaxID=2952649 RepID=UPI00211518AF|nr:ribosomal protein S14 [Prosopanche panguanensis]USN93699.1 ribosomal protein S14 [Prosopanche panguanensis]